MMILRYKNSSDYNELIDKLKKIKRFSGELEDFLCNAEENDSYAENQKSSYRNDYDRDNYDRDDYGNNNSRSVNRYYYPRR